MPYKDINKKKEHDRNYKKKLRGTQLGRKRLYKNNQKYRDKKIEWFEAYKKTLVCYDCNFKNVSLYVLIVIELEKLKRKINS